MRKIIYTKVLIDLIAGCIFDGLTDEETSILSKIPQKQISRLRLGEDCPAIRESTIQRMRVYVAKIRDGNDRTNHWQRIAWFLERRYPDRWAKPEVLLNVNAGSNVTNNTLVITAEQAARDLRNRNANIDKALQELVPPGSRDRTHGTIPEEAKSLIIKDSASQLHSVVPNDGESLINDSVPNKAESIDDLSATTPAPLPRTPDVAAAGVASQSLTKI